jgi:hypothetical protein
VALDLTREPRPGGRLYGAFKARAMAGYRALLRLAWAAFHQPASPHDFPSQLLGPWPPRQYRFDWEQDRENLAPGPFLSSLRDFLSGASDHLLQLLNDALPAREGLSTFQRAQQASDLEVLTAFYSLGPRRNRELSRQHELPSPLILQEEPDDLLAERPEPRNNSIFRLRGIPRYCNNVHF